MTGNIPRGGNCDNFFTQPISDDFKAVVVVGTAVEGSQPRHELQASPCIDVIKMGTRRLFPSLCVSQTFGFRTDAWWSNMGALLLLMHAFLTSTFLLLRFRGRP